MLFNFLLCLCFSFCEHLVLLIWPFNHFCAVVILAESGFSKEHAGDERERIRCTGTKA